MKMSNTNLSETTWMTHSASSYLQTIESTASFRWRGTSASRSMPRTTARVVLRAPLAPNANHKGTAFGGSLFCVAVLTGWAWATRYIAARGLNADAVIQESTIRYLKPVHGEFRGGRSQAPPAEQRGRIPQDAGAFRTRAHPPARGNSRRPDARCAVRRRIRGGPAPRSAI